MGFGYSFPIALLDLLRRIKGGIAIEVFEGHTLFGIDALPVVEIDLGGMDDDGGFGRPLGGILGGILGDLGGLSGLDGLFGFGFGCHYFFPLCCVQYTILRG